MKGRCEIRVRYADTDQMGVVYYGRYLEWFEVGRTEYLRQVGWPYAKMEEEGIFLPVIEAYVSYAQPARYDELISVWTTLEFPRPARIKLVYTVMRGDTLLASGYTVHAFMNNEGKPIRPPRALIEQLSVCSS